MRGVLLSDITCDRPLDPYATTRSSSELLRFVRPKRAPTLKSFSGPTTILHCSGSTSHSVLSSLCQGRSALHFLRRPFSHAAPASAYTHGSGTPSCSLRRIAFATVAQTVTASYASTCRRFDRGRWVQLKSCHVTIRPNLVVARHLDAAGGIGPHRRPRPQDSTRR